MHSATLWSGKSHMKLVTMGCAMAVSVGQTPRNMNELPNSIGLIR